MLITYEVALKNFDTWSGANKTKDELTEKELDIIDCMLSELYPDGLDKTAINDFLWFERDTIAEWLDFNNWNDLVEFHESEN